MGNRFFYENFLTDLLSMFNHDHRISTFGKDSSGRNVNTFPGWMWVPADAPIATLPRRGKIEGMVSLEPVVSADRTAYPSTTDLVKPGISPSARISSARMRWSASTSVTGSSPQRRARFLISSIAFETETTCKKRLI